MSRKLEVVNLRPLFFGTRRFSRVLGVIFVLAAAVGWIAVGYDLGELRAVAATRGGEPLGAAALLAHAEAGRRIALTQIACAVLVAAVFVPWLHQARANVRALGARRLRFGREWTYLAFAIPVLNAYRPYQVVSEIWRSSDPASVDPLGWQRLPSSRLVLTWWLALVGWIACDALAALLLAIAPGVERTQIAHVLALAGDVSAAAAASFGYFLVTRISDAQDAKWAAFGRSEFADLGADAARTFGPALGAGA
jgi:hypothetical protein